MKGSGGAEKVMRQFTCSKNWLSGGGGYGRPAGAMTTALCNTLELGY